MTESLEKHLRDALAALRTAREILPEASAIQVRDVLRREIVSAETSIFRVLNLIGGQP